MIDNKFRKKYNMLFCQKGGNTVNLGINVTLFSIEKYLTGLESHFRKLTIFLIIHVSIREISN